MGDMFEQQKKLQEQQMQALQQQQEQQSRQVNLQQNVNQYATQESLDVQMVENLVAANAYLQQQKDADAAAPDENREELLRRQMTIGLGKSTGIQKAHDQAGV